MATTNTATKESKTELEKQRVYSEKLKKQGFGYDLVIGDAFIRGMRDIGYKHTGTALDELIDNAIEAGAHNILIDFETDKNGKKPLAIALIDDGHGMESTMLRAAVMWGGTHRENSRSGIGRYGYGLPSASVSQGKRFSVYSKIKNGDWNAITIDLDEISSGSYTKDGRIVTPEPKKTELPNWVKASIKESKLDLKSGTIVILEKLDRLSWATVSGLTGNLVEHIGITYRNYLINTKIKIADTTVEAIDPLFITSDFRYYDLDEDRAIPLEPMRIPVKIEGRDTKAIVNIRFAQFPLTFGAPDKKKAVSAKNQNPRWHIMNDHRGIIVTRMGRQIDVITRTPRIWKALSSITNNNARYWGVEIDFPADLDEDFSVTTSKQRVELTERIWEILTNNGLERTIQALQQRVDRDQKAGRHKKDGENNEPRISEQVMAETKKFTHFVPGQTSEEREAASREAFEQEVKRRKEREKKSEKQVREELESETQQSAYKVEFEDLPGGTFFRSDQIGPQLVIYINKRHSFYSSLYASKESSTKIRSALELLLFVIGQAEIDAMTNKDRKLFYSSERHVWSKNLDIAFELLGDISHFESEEDDTDRT